MSFGSCLKDARADVNVAGSKRRQSCLPGAERGERRVGAPRAEREPARLQVRDVALVVVEPVEEEVDRAHGALEGRGVGDLVAVQPLEGECRVQLVHVGGSRAGQRHRPALQRGRARDGPVHGPQQLELDVAGRGARVAGRRAGCAQRALLDLHRHAAALVAVVPRLPRGRAPARLAEHLHELVHVVGGGRGRAPREVLAAAEQVVEADARERHAAGVHAAAVEVELEQDLGRVVGHLGAGHPERAARRSTRRRGRASRSRPGGRRRPCRGSAGTAACGPSPRRRPGAPRPPRRARGPSRDRARRPRVDRAGAAPPCARGGGPCA